VIPAKATMHLKSQLDTRCPIANRNPIEGNKMAKELRPAAKWVSPKGNEWVMGKHY
jgi:hypothetical protein